MLFLLMAIMLFLFLLLLIVVVVVVVMIKKMMMLFLLMAMVFLMVVLFLLMLMLLIMVVTLKTDAICEFVLSPHWSVILNRIEHLYTTYSEVLILLVFFWSLYAMHMFLRYNSS